MAHVGYQQYAGKYKLRYALIALLLFASVAAGQSGNTIIRRFAGIPTGACSTIQVAVNNATGDFYDCLAGAWHAVGGGGGGTPGGSNTQLQYNNAGAFGGITGSQWDLANRTLRLLTATSGEMFAFSTDPAGDAGNCGAVFYVNCSGIRAASVSGASGTNGGAIEFDGVDGGNTTIATSGAGGNGTPIILISGGGGQALNANTNSTGGNSGAVSLSINNAGDATGTGINVGGNGGTITLSPGTGGAASGGTSNTGGSSGNLIINLRPGGTGSTANGAPSEFQVNAFGVGTVFSVTREGNVNAFGSEISLTSTDDNPSLTIKSTTGVNPIPGLILSINNTRDWRMLLAGNSDEQIVFSHDGSTAAELSVGGEFKSRSFATWTNCANGSSPATCGASPAGAVAIPTGVTTVSLVVNTSAVTANSRIMLSSDDTTTISGVTCNNTLATLVGGLAITARTAGTSFTITYNGTIATNPLCVSYWIVN